MLGDQQLWTWIERVKRKKKLLLPEPQQKPLPKTDDAKHSKKGVDTGKTTSGETSTPAKRRIPLGGKESRTHVLPVNSTGPYIEIKREVDKKV